MDKLTTEQVEHIFHRKSLSKEFTETLITLLDIYGETFKIDTRIRRVRFLAQAVHEVGINRDGSIRLRESLDYHYEALPIYSKYFRLHPEYAEMYGRTDYHKANQVMIANLWYGNRLGNRGALTDDGWNYRGFGIFQTTGRRNFKNDINVVHSLIVDRIADVDYNVFEDVKSFILIGMGHWYRTKMYECNGTMCVTNIINRGLPRKNKQERVDTAISIDVYLTRESEAIQSTEYRVQ